MASPLNNTVNIIKKNKALISTLILVFVIMGTYYWYVYSEYKKEQDRYQKARIAGVCPDYWENVGDGTKITLKCKNVKKIGRCNITDSNNEKNFDNELYTNKENGDLAKCKWSKYCRAPWEGISDLCADVDMEWN